MIISDIESASMVDCLVNGYFQVDEHQCRPAHYWRDPATNYPPFHNFLKHIASIDKPNVVTPIYSRNHCCLIQPSPAMPEARLRHFNVRLWQHDIVGLFEQIAMPDNLSVGLFNI